eukprot:8561904-Lingulodinium_polyedra.AAC.1
MDRRSLGNLGIASDAQELALGKIVNVCGLELGIIWSPRGHPRAEAVRSAMLRWQPAVLLRT